MASYKWPATTSGSGTGTVTSVALLAPASILSVSGSPITVNGTFNLSLVTQSANRVWAGPTTGSAATPTFRALVVADIPSLPASQITSGKGSISTTTTNLVIANGANSTLGPNVTIDLTEGNLTDVGTDGIVITGGTGAVIGSGTSIAQHVADSTHNGYLSSTDWSTFNAKQSALTIGNLTDVGTDGIVVTGGTGAVIGSGTSLAQHVADASHNGYLSSTDWSTFNGKGSVSSVTFTGDGTVLSSTPSSPVTTTGTLTAALKTQVKNTFLSGPVSGSNAAPTFRVLASEDFIAPTVQMFSSGSGTYTTPTSPRTPLYLKIVMVGGGGGGSGSGSGSFGAGGDGTDSTFGVSLTAGFGGGAADNGGPGAGGTAVGGYLNVNGNTGGTAISTATGYGSVGGSSPFFGGGGIPQGPGSPGYPGASMTGGGGSGGGPAGTQDGGGGGSGGYVEAIISSPSSTYAYSVGAGGAGGTAGTGGVGGGGGGSGLVLVQEYYQ